MGQWLPPCQERGSFLLGPGDCADEPCDTFVVEETEKGFQSRVEVPSLLYKYIIGKKGETKKRLETETRTSISIPKPGVEGEIVITGQHRSGVISARTRIDVLLDSFRKKQPFTHFLSFALNQPAIQEKFLQFKEEVLEKCSKDHGVTSSLFQNPAKLHLTLGTLVLLNEQEIQKACGLLQQCKEDFVDQITGGKPLTVEVAGVEYMNDDPAMTDVLYAKVHMKDGSDKLQVIADQLVERFVASGLMLKEWDRVKLHATVMNTLFRKDPGAEERNNTVTGKSSFKERESFNGQNILKAELRLLACSSHPRSQRLGCDPANHCAAADGVGVTIFPCNTQSEGDILASSSAPTLPFMGREENPKAVGHILPCSVPDPPRHPRMLCWGV
ncbi:activating signal cointegrator 1 complex subunit 1 isoform X2 [Cuculus canorus]|uniref:activating signal cointegrator 1 complex subunit 1 isoform X2 n=1 Tax=Cuculus canorus TaxID=55661 RepID=UPI0023AA2517|nr:activating signal cointegrator 1 complex subunit 1 isoform X2 [Cuculus canorus]